MRFAMYVAEVYCKNKSMVWVFILAWVVIAAALVVFVLRLAQGESHDRTFTQALDERAWHRAHKGEPEEDEQETRLPRIGGTTPAFTPQQSGQELRQAHTYGDDEETMDHPVYVNEDFVVEMKAMKTPGAQSDSAAQAPHVAQDGQGQD
ncbi:hypothetical protein KIMH_14830 [Bombiscardovia apis]|uniref:Uncharacterized protein n=2 Tax=Bombiscardovia apis TaxID=2932182 RepID=A0ABM8BEN9_9BIFI|nr:hypothetical protein KIMH_14830 [Bombiscardovia apis]